MTTDLEMLVWTAGMTALMWLPYIMAHVVKHGLAEALTYRADVFPLEGWAARAKKAHYNAIENLIPFAVLVIAATLTASSNGRDSGGLRYVFLGAGCALCALCLGRPLRPNNYLRGELACDALRLLAHHLVAASYHRIYDSVPVD